GMLPEGYDSATKPSRAGSFEPSEQALPHLCGFARCAQSSPRQGPAEGHGGACASCDGADHCGHDVGVLPESGCADPAERGDLPTPTLECVLKRESPDGGGSGLSRGHSPSLS